MAELTPEFLDSTRLLFDLQQASQIAQSLSGCLDPEAIAGRVTDGLVQKFGCAFARLWLVEPDRTALKLVASSGIYTRLDGTFARVPMGAFKVGKIAQHRIPFLSNHLADETWVKDREWAIAHKIRGFAGYPLAASETVVGVLAVFSRQAMAPEFLEVLQGLCTTVTIALENALRYQQEQSRKFPTQIAPGKSAPLSEELAAILSPTRLILVGTERPLTAPLTWIFLRATETLSQVQCIYGRLTYSATQISLEAIVPTEGTQTDSVVSAFGDLLFAAACLGGALQIQAGLQQKGVQILLTVPYPSCVLGPRLRIQCRSSVLQMAFTHLAYLAGLTVCLTEHEAIPLLTDQPTQTAAPILWLETNSGTPPNRIDAQLNLSISPSQLREAVEFVSRGESWGLDLQTEPHHLSDREQEIMALLSQGLRDREIANQLHISERTVKFHVNNMLTKLKARTRFQALYQAMLNGWISA